MTLTFTELGREHLATTIRAEFCIRDEAHEHAEFIVALHDLALGGRLWPQVRCFSDGLPSLNAFLDLDGSELLLADVAGAQAFALRLLAAGLSKEAV